FTDHLTGDSFIWIWLHFSADWLACHWHDLGIVWIHHSLPVRNVFFWPFAQILHLCTLFLNRYRGNRVPV
ncbi:hypothetical protein GW17_00022912, partial [Ensete ventricosum]